MGAGILVSTTSSLFTATASSSFSYSTSDIFPRIWLLMLVRQQRGIDAKMIRQPSSTSTAVAATV